MATTITPEQALPEFQRRYANAMTDLAVRDIAISLLEGRITDLEKENAGLRTERALPQAELPG